MTLFVTFALALFGCGLLFAAPWNGQARFARAARIKAGRRDDSEYGVR
jgi:hypothetical protein